jgi:hypothetical protein
MLQCNGSIPVHFQPISFRLRHQLGRLCLRCFWDSQGVLLVRLEKIWILYCTVKLFWTVWMQFTENIQVTWQDRHCFIMTMADPIPPEQPKGELRNYNGNFLNMCLTARTLTLVNSICLVRYRANISLMTKRLNRRCGSGWDNSQKTSVLWVLTHW